MSKFKLQQFTEQKLKDAGVSAESIKDFNEFKESTLNFDERMLEDSDIVETDKMLYDFIKSEMKEPAKKKATTKKATAKKFKLSEFSESQLKDAGVSAESIKDFKEFKETTLNFDERMLDDSDIAGIDKELYDFIKSEMKEPAKKEPATKKAASKKKMAKAPNNLSQFKKWVKSNIGSTMYLQAFDFKPEKAYDLQKRVLDAAKTTYFESKKENGKIVAMDYGKASQWRFYDNHACYKDEFIKLCYFYEKPTKEELEKIVLETIGDDVLGEDKKEPAKKESGVRAIVLEPSKKEANSGKLKVGDVLDTKAMDDLIDAGDIMFKDIENQSVHYEFSDGKGLIEQISIKPAKWEVKQLGGVSVTAKKEPAKKEAPKKDVIKETVEEVKKEPAKAKEKYKKSDTKDPKPLSWKVDISVGDLHHYGEVKILDVCSGMCKHLAVKLKKDAEIDIYLAGKVKAKKGDWVIMVRSNENQEMYRQFNIVGSPNEKCLVFADVTEDGEVKVKAEKMPMIEASESDTYKGTAKLSSKVMKRLEEWADEIGSRASAQETILENKAYDSDLEKRAREKLAKWYRERGNSITGAILELKDGKIANPYSSGENIPKIIADGNKLKAVSKEAYRDLDKYLSKTQTTKEQYASGEGYVDTRKWFHSQIVDAVAKDVGCIVREEPIAIILGGLPHSGKNTFISKYAKWLESPEIMKIDSCRIKSMLPEYEGWNNELIYEEAKDIIFGYKGFNGLMQEINKDCMHDVLLCGWMKDKSEYQSQIKKLKKMGYKIHLVYLDIEVQEALNRRDERFQTEVKCKYVPEKVYKGQLSRSKKVFEDLYRMEEVDGHTMVDGMTMKIVKSGGMKIPADRNYEFLMSEEKATKKRAVQKKVGTPTAVKYFDDEGELLGEKEVTDVSEVRQDPLFKKSDKIEVSKKGDMSKAIEGYVKEKGKLKKSKAKKSSKKKEAPKKEAPKKEAPKKEAPKKEAPKKEAPKKEAPKKEAPKKEEP
jgi:uncharacterized protein YjiS (DUF1127 family)